MSDSKIVKNMITFIEQTEKDIQAEKFDSSSKLKAKAVANILEKLEREIKNEDQEY